MDKEIEDIIQAALELFVFEWDEKDQRDPPGGVVSKDCVSCIGIDDYEKEEQLVVKLGLALKRAGRYEGWVE